MSARGIEFLQKWVEENVPPYSTSDPALAAKLAKQATADAIKAGIRPEEISEEVGSMLTTMLEVLENPDTE
ncbi:DUF768 domain-containing protein [Mesorhizobium sp. B2-3-3]|uniref:DUF768 domain-containing protein n=1 Tax=unclassified Mesorhizobium TaxID=325217 RepID=UPI0011294CCB|nr:MULTISPECIES: DUF768 domain-containing protein [unclassified Mesorhizobium]TPK73536.1 DUF768 domain-containing protein [Mesorhizobium sp. B2-4-15]TPM24846.1 DUF768 domain-containing protein [Mesorhizobium sp. B2-3-5]TPN33557.1 DUF768 domain-containing protein [Mesorhizobium sp. B2-3-3]